MKRKLLITTGVIFVLFIIGAIVAEPATETSNIEDVATSESSQDASTTEQVLEQPMQAGVTLDNLAGFTLNTEDDGIYSFSSTSSNHSPTVATGLENLEGHRDFYPLSREKITISSIPVEIGFNEADDFEGGAEAHYSLAFDFTYKAEGMTGEISNLDFTSDKAGLQDTLKQFITALQRVNQ